MVYDGMSQKHTFPHMNTMITFPPPAPSLKLVRSATNPPSEKWAATLAEERRRLQEDQEALREREANLRDYEARLRALQAELEAGRGAPPVTARTATTAAPFLRPTSKAPFSDETALQAAWEKFHRARELFESEQSHMRDERIVLKDQQAEVKQRETAVAARETAVAQREELVAAATPPVAAEHTMSAVTRLTRGPFNMARSVFGGKK